MLSLSRRSLRPSVLPCCSADDEDIAPCGAANTKTRAGPRAVRKQPSCLVGMHTDHSR
jgi:hypothetical protein